jgi:heptaprenyl diphosphate synthase
MLLLRAQAQTDGKAAELVEFIDSGLEDNAKLAEAVKRLREHEVAEQAYQQAKRWADEAVAALAPLPDSNVKSALKNFAEAVVDRDN